MTAETAPVSAAGLVVRVRRWARTRAALLAATVVCCGLIASLAVGAALREAARGHADERMDRVAAAVQTAVSAQLNRYLDAVGSAAAGLGAQSDLPSSAFEHITEPISDSHLPGAQAIAFVVPAATADTERVQRYWQQHGVPGLQLRPLANTDQHLYTVLIRGLGARTLLLPGTDTAAAPALADGVRRTRDTSAVTISDAHVLLADAALPAAERQLSFVVTAAVRRTDGSLLGYLVLGVRGTEFMTSTLRTAGGTAVTAELDNRSVTGAPVQIAAISTGRAPDLRREAVFPAGQRLWTLRTGAAYGTLVPTTGRTDLVVTIAGALLSVLFGLLVHLQAAGRRRAEEAVVAATAEAHAAEQKARDQAGLLHSVMNSISDGVSVVDQNGRFVLHNPAAAMMLGPHAADNVPPAEWIARVGAYRQDGVTPFPADELPLVRTLAGQAQDNVPMVIRNVHQPQGLVITVSTRPLDSTGGHRGAVAICHDITDRTRADHELAEATTRLQVELAQRRAAEQELRAARDELATQKDYLAQVLDAMEIAIVTCDADGRIVHANQVTRDRLPASTRPLSVAEFAAHFQTMRRDGTVPGPDELPLMRALTGEAVEDEELLTGPPGRQRTLLAHTRALRRASGEIFGAVISTHDVTALREREADLSAFAGVVAHDLRSPLATIGGYAELIDDELADLPGATAAAGRRHLHRITNTVERMRRLIEDLLTYTSAGDAPLNLTDVDLRAVVDEVAAAYLDAIRDGAERPDLFVGLLPAVHADAVMVRQLVDNLIGNALKYTPPGQVARIDVTARVDAGLVKLEVADRGIGIPPGQHEAIFTGFHRAHRGEDYAGSGLGLAICHRIARRHGGTIGAADNPGGGAVFHVTLPPAVPEESPDARAGRAVVGDSRR